MNRIVCCRKLQTQTYKSNLITKTLNFFIAQNYESSICRIFAPPIACKNTDSCAHWAIEPFKCNYTTSLRHQTLETADFKSLIGVKQDGRLHFDRFAAPIGLLTTSGLISKRNIDWLKFDQTPELWVLCG